MAAESRRSRQALRLEILALALLAIVPILPYVAQVLAGVPRYEMAADFALQEYDVRHVWHGETLLGLGSRWRWSHPGPLLFYFIAPFQKIFGVSSTGLYFGTWALSAVSAATIVAALRKWAGRGHAISALFVIVCWFGAFGNVASNPWVRLVLALPLFAYLVLAALFARGATRAAIAAIPFGTVVVQTHILTTETVGLVGVAALGAFVFAARRRGGLTLEEKRGLRVAAALGLVLFLPPIFEQVTAPTHQGNIRKLISFALGRSEAPKTLGAAFESWASANAWLVDRLLSKTLLTEGPMPMMMRWDCVPPGITRTAWSILTVQLGAFAVAGVIARQRRDTVSVALIAIGLLGSVAAIHSVRAMAGQEHFSLLFWTTAGSAVSWIGAVSVVGAEIWRVVSGFLAGRRAPLIVLGLFGFGVVLASTSMQRVWLSHNHHLMGTNADVAALHRGSYEAVRKRIGTALVPVLHFDGSWDDAFSVLLELDKDGVNFRVADADAWVIPRRRHVPDGPLLHFWFGRPDLPVPVASCLEQVAMSGDRAVYASANDVEKCPAP